MFDWRNTSQKNKDKTKKDEETDNIGAQHLTIRDRLENRQADKQIDIQIDRKTVKQREQQLTYIRMRLLG